MALGKSVSLGITLTYLFTFQFQVHEETLLLIFGSLCNMSRTYGTNLNRFSGVLQQTKNFALCTISCIMDAPDKKSSIQNSMCPPEDDGFSMIPTAKTLVE